MRKIHHSPAYREHKPSGQARVIVDGKHVYLGRYGSEESKKEYERIAKDPQRPHGSGDESQGHDIHRPARC